MQIGEIEEYKSAVRLIAKEIPAGDSRILVTGASGLIGSVIVDALLCANRHQGADYQIFALGRNREKLEKRFGRAPSVRILAQDIAEPIQTDGLDYVVHAASFADPSSYARYPAETILTNVLGARSVLDYCRGKTTRALLTSTFEVYGKNDLEGFAEEDCGWIDCNLIRSSYPESKRTAELLFRAYYEEYAVDGVIARLPSVYGPILSEHDNKAHAEFIRNAVNRRPIVLKSAGLQKRTYCYVMDIVSGLLYLLFHGKSGEAYNVANQASRITIAGLARLIADIAGTEVVFQTPDAEESKGYSKPQNSVLLTGKINRLGWHARYSLEEGIRETLEIVKKMRQNDQIREIPEA